MAKEKIEKICQIESEIDGSSLLLANNWQKAGVVIIFYSSL